MDQGKTDAVEEAERTMLEAKLASLERERDGYYRQNAQGLLDDSKLRMFLAEVAERKEAIDTRLAELRPPEVEQVDALPDDLLEQIRQRLEAGLSEKDRQEIARLLVRRIVVTTKTEDNRRWCVAEVEYRFPDGAVNLRRAGRSR